MKRFGFLFLVLLLALLFCSHAWAGASVFKSVGASGVYTEKILIKTHGTVRISGTFVGTVELQRSDDNGGSWVDTGDTWTAGGVFTFTDYTNKHYRIGTSAYTSGTINLWLGSAD
ncbi:MAG: hypothetical protein M0R06_01695 [Sphaerochaeta sp.]|jgi:hypothetical protein|nr:hypothetical protein [Sphaerochaeta sp.]